MHVFDCMRKPVSNCWDACESEESCCFLFSTILSCLSLSWSADDPHDTRGISVRRIWSMQSRFEFTSMHRWRIEISWNSFFRRIMLGLWLDFQFFFWKNNHFHISAISKKNREKTSKPHHYVNTTKDVDIQWILSAQLVSMIEICQYSLGEKCRECLWFRPYGRRVWLL